MPTFPDPAQPPQYPKTLDGLKLIQVNASSTQDARPQANAIAEDYNFLARNLVAVVSDLRAFIVSFGLDPDAIPDGQTMEDAAADILARIAAAGGGGGGESLSGIQLASALLTIGSGQTWSARRFYQERRADASGLDLTDSTYQVHSNSVTEETFGTHVDPGNVIDVGYPQFGDFFDGVKTIRQVTVRVRASWPPGASQATVVKWTWNGISYEYRFTALGPDEEG